MPCIGGLTTGVLALGYPEILYQARQCAFAVCVVCDGLCSAAGCDGFATGGYATNPRG